MDFKTVSGIKKYGFSGFRSVRELWDDKSVIPNAKGVYLVLIPSITKPIFINPGVGPKLYKKKKDPNVSIDELESNWVNNTLTVYIGKAGGYKKDGSEMDATLRSRLADYLKFGQGKDVRHYGGRYIWQLKFHSDLVLCWKQTPNDDPREVEKQLFDDFIEQYNKRSFANLRG